MDNKDVFAKNLKYYIKLTTLYNIFLESFSYSLYMIHLITLEGLLNIKELIILYLLNNSHPISKLTTIIICINNVNILLNLYVLINSLCSLDNII